MKQLANLLYQYVDEHGLEEEFRLARLQHQWDQIVEAPFHQHVQPRQIDGDTLVLVAEEATWRQEADLLAPRILDSVNQFLGSSKLRDIRVKHGSTSGNGRSNR